jgi:anti-sigma regulatory factor (Ser/Thr protein kinase)
MPRSTLDLLLLEVPCDEHAPAVVRRALAEIDQAGLPLDDGVLVASELVTNAVLHAACETERLLEVCARRRRDRLLISVHGPGRSGECAAPDRRPDSELGLWGMRIIARLSQRWGCDWPDGYRVWAELALEA